MNSKILPVIALLLFCAAEAFSQDTTVIQTLRFSDTTKRRGFYVFPPKSNNYRKVLMYHTLKCDPATTQDQYPCGEWDYIALTTIYQHLNPWTPYYTLNGQSPDTIGYSSQPVYTYRQKAIESIVYDNTVSEQAIPIGNQALTATGMFTANAAGKSQLLFRASELTAAGLHTGRIDKLRFTVITPGGELRQVMIRMKHSQLTDFSPALYESTGWQTVLELHATSLVAGENEFQLAHPFDWDGTSNIAIEFTFSGSSAGEADVVAASPSGFGSMIYAQTDDSYLSFTRPDYIEVPVSDVADIDSFYTVTSWVYGNPDKATGNDQRLFEGINANNARVFSVQLPYTDEVVYYDAGKSNFDRISKKMTPAEYKGSWHHWAFVKDVVTKKMSIYLDGVLWHEETGKTQTVDAITSFRIGAAGNSTGLYYGFLDEFRVWNAALSEAEIRETMNRDLEPTDSHYGNLLIDYRMDETSGLTVKNSAGPNDASLYGPPNWTPRNGAELYKNMKVETDRPNITFVQGEYVTHLDTLIVTDTIQHPGILIYESVPEIQMNKRGITFRQTQTHQGWQANQWSFTYDPSGKAVDSVWITPDAFFYNQYKLKTHQVQNFITPYGIGLSLGDDGFTWAYDVTDYLPILHDTVDIEAGNQQELIDLKFLFVHGTPPRDVVDFQTIWNAEYNHVDIANDKVMKAVDIQLNPEAKQYSVKTRTTGHRFGGFENCAEFCPKYHNLKVNGLMADEWLNWTTCATNPVIDQGGTWIYDRAGWCPGAFADTYDHDITEFVTPGSVASIDYGMQTTAGGMEGVYVVSVALISYKDNNFTLDASVDDIISPSTWDYHNRVNPICDDPTVVIKNTGATPLTSLDITYNVKGGTPETFKWTGTLLFQDKEQVKLPVSSMDFWKTTDTTNVFEVSVANPNGSTDEYAGNNSLFSTFQKPDVITTKFSIWLRTNSAGSENTYTLKDINGTTLLSRKNLKNNTTYIDTLDLPDGCYYFEMLDSDDDGLSFFANNDGSGQLLFRKVPGTSSIKTFNRNFGRFIKYWFTMDRGISSVEQPAVPRNATVSPNPGSGLYSISIEGYPGERITLSVTDITGKLIHTEEMMNYTGNMTTPVNLTGESNGIYFIKIASPNSSSVHRVIKQ